LIYPKKTSLPARLHCTPVRSAPSSSSRNDDNNNIENNNNDNDDNNDNNDENNWKLSKEDRLFVDFVRYMLHLDPTKRPSAVEAMKHPWFEGTKLCKYLCM
jgi:serine/threonine protein kinase